MNIAATATEAPVIDLKASRVYACMECGRCTAVCPVARTHDFSPRKQLSRTISNGRTAFEGDATIWACLTCKQCETVCPAEIPYADLNRRARQIARKSGTAHSFTHGGLFEQISELMLRPKLQQDRLDWVSDDIQVRKRSSETLFFTGCTPYFAAYFGEGYAEKLTGALRASVKLMNGMDIQPLVLENERCCGHDLLLRGETEKFAGLAGMVAEQIQKAKVERVVVSCPECLVTLRDEYPKLVGKLGVEVMHISELFHQARGAWEFKEAGETVTYQDPCRLGRYSGIYDQPREMLQSVPGVQLHEMRHNRDRATCCGNTAWIGCDAGTRVMQNGRLKEASETGSGTLLTACPKCLIHLTCSQTGAEGKTESPVEIRDIWEFMGSQLK